MLAASVLQSLCSDNSCCKGQWNLTNRSTPFACCFSPSLKLSGICIFFKYAGRFGKASVPSRKWFLQGCEQRNKYVPAKRVVRGWKIWDFFFFLVEFVNKMILECFSVGQRVICLHVFSCRSRDDAILKQHIWWISSRRPFFFISQPTRSPAGSYREVHSDPLSPGTRGLSNV